MQILLFYFFRACIQLIKEMEELKAFKTKQSQKMKHLEQKLVLCHLLDLDVSVLFYV